MSVPRVFGLPHLSEDAVAAFADGVLSEAAAGRARRHCAECTECADAVRGQRETAMMLRTAQAPSLPAGLLDRLAGLPMSAPLPPPRGGLPTTIGPDGVPVFIAHNQAHGLFADEGPEPEADLVADPVRPPQQHHHRRGVLPMTMLASAAAVVAAGALGGGQLSTASPTEGPAANLAPAAAAPSRLLPSLQSQAGFTPVSFSTADVGRADDAGPRAVAASRVSRASRGQVVLGLPVTGRVGFTPAP